MCPAPQQDMMKALMCFLYELAPPTWLRMVGNLLS